MLSEQDSQRAIADRLANKIISEEDPFAVCRLLEAEECITVSQQTIPDRAITGDATPQRVGIWDARLENGELWFVRRNELDTYGLWARCERISAKTSRTRIVLLGESVARGFPYDPYYNCATALQEVLSNSFGDDVEVVDLARNGALYSELLEIAESAAVLHPDAYVVFAGNNWLVPGGLSLSEAAEILKSGGGWSGIQALVRNQMRAGISKLASFLGRLSREQKVPIIFVIPEFNIDWRAHLGWEAPILSYEERYRWRSLLAEATSALNRSEFACAAALARAMTGIDEGASPVALEIQAQAERALGHTENARLLMDLACNSNLYLPVPKRDRCSPMLCDTLREELPVHGIIVADFPATCREFLGDAFPDSRIFLEYCHLTPEGIRLAMACAAEVLLPRLGKPFQSWRKLMDHPAMDHPITVNDKAEAQARFNAAVMAAMDEQAEATICRYLEEAARVAPEIIDLSLLVAEAHIRRMPIVFCDAFDRLLAFQNTFPEIVRLAYAFPNKEKEPNLPLIAAICKIASAKRPEVQDIIDGLLLQEYGIEGGSVDLLHPAYCDLSCSMDCDWEESSVSLKSHEHESRFRLFSDHATPLALVLTYRTPDKVVAGEELTIWLNDQKIESFSPAQSWRTIHFDLPAKLLRRGINILAIRWPEPKRSREEQTAFIIPKLTTAGGRNSWRNLPEIYPIYGEVFSFAASPVSSAGERISVASKESSALAGVLMQTSPAPDEDSRNRI
jgi:hypothetical protein